MITAAYIQSQVCRKFSGTSSQQHQGLEDDLESIMTMQHLNHHDNAASHKARLTQAYLAENGIRLMQHIPLLTRLDFLRILAFSKS